MLFRSPNPGSTLHNTVDRSAAPEAILDALRTAERFLVHCDDHNTPLLPLYDGTYTVVQRFFKLKMGDWQDTVHVSRLKPFAAQQTPTATPPSTAGLGSASPSQRTNQHRCRGPFFRLYHPGGFLHDPAVPPQTKSTPSA